VDGLMDSTLASECTLSGEELGIEEDGRLWEGCIGGEEDLGMGTRR
jgi:hypothetical protein